MAARTKVLAVQNLDGRMLTAEIERRGGTVFVRTEPIHETIEDGTNNTLDGRIVYEIHAAGYMESIGKLERYLESLMLKEMSREDRNSSNESRSDTRRAPAEPITGGAIADPGEDDPSVDSGGDGNEPAPRPRKRRKPKAVLGEEGDSGATEGGESRDEAFPGPREGDE